MKKLIIEKQDTSSKYTTDYTENEDYSETDIDYTDSIYQQTGGVKVFDNLSKAKYKKPNRGSKQDNLTREEIKQKLQGYIPLRTMEDKKMLTKMTPFKTWVRYINNDTKQFRTGGLLMKIEYPKYIMLANTNKNLTWSVQLKENTIYIRDPKYSEEQKQEKEKEIEIKDRLYEMYKKGQLQSKK